MVNTYYCTLDCRAGLLAEVKRGGNRDSLSFESEAQSRPRTVEDQQRANGDWDPLCQHGGASLTIEEWNLDVILR